MISVPRAGWPPVMCINTTSFSLNAITWSMYRSTSLLLTPDCVPRFKNRSLTASPCPTRSYNQNWPSTGMRVRGSFKKLKPSRWSVGLSRKLSHGTLGMGGALFMLPINSSSIINRRLSTTSPCIMPRNWAMLNSKSLYSSCSLPTHSTCPRVVVL